MVKKSPHPLCATSSKKPLFTNSPFKISVSYVFEPEKLCLRVSILLRIVDFPLLFAPQRIVNGLIDSVSKLQNDCDVTRSVSKMTEIERRGGKRWDKPKKAGKSRDCRGGKF